MVIPPGDFSIDHDAGGESRGIFVESQIFLHYTEEKKKEAAP